MTTCLTCGKQTTNPKFCSRSCSATFTNTSHPKRIKEGVCASCGEPIHSTRKFCKVCYKTIRNTVSEQKIGDVKNKHQTIRHHARTLAIESGTDKSCVICGYNKHVEVCHIKPVSEFDSEATVAEVNALENLVLLCPNCHWEFDHFLMDRTLIDKKIERPEGFAPSLSAKGSSFTN